MIDEKQTMLQIGGFIALLVEIRKYGPQLQHLDAENVLGN